MIEISGNDNEAGRQYSLLMFANMMLGESITLIANQDLCDKVVKAVLALVDLADLTVKKMNCEKIVLDNGAVARFIPYASGLNSISCHVILDKPENFGSAIDFAACASVIHGFSLIYRK